MTTNHVMVDPITVISFPDPERTSTPVAASTFNDNAGITLAFSSLAQLDAALILAGDTQAYLNTLTINDKVFRLRTLIANGSLTAANLLPTATIQASTNPTTEVEPWGAVWINELTPAAFQSDGNGNWTNIW